MPSFCSALTLAGSGMGLEVALVADHCTIQKIYK